MADIYLYNTLTRRKQKFVPIEKGRVRIYNCGPTVYYDAHIGNYLSFTFRDVLRRTLKYFGYKVKSVMNITDVGHLVSDQDSGEDKMEKAARREHKSVWEIAEYYIKKIFGDLKYSPGFDPNSEMGKLNFERPEIIARATDNISDMIEMIRVLERKGFVYTTKLGVYFDVTKFKGYGKLSGQKLEEKLVQVREEVVSDPEKKHPLDFAVWLFTRGIHAHHEMRWNSPWGEGFPGWHIECSVISTKYLGNPFDIHTGGVDHIPVHHENEIAQTEAATGRKMANFWIHNEFNLVDGRKMSKSLGNFYTLGDIEKRGFEPLALRYLYLTSHYRTPLNFTWKSMEDAQKSLDSLRGYLKTWVWEIGGGKNYRLGREVLEEEIERRDITPAKRWVDYFSGAIGDDLNIPLALGIVWKMVKDPKLTAPVKIVTLIDFDRVLGLRLKEWILSFDLSQGEEIEGIVKQRERYRKAGEWKEADKLRDQLRTKGIEVEDTEKGSVWKWVK